MSTLHKLPFHSLRNSNLPKKHPSTDRFCFLYDCFFGLQLGA